MRKLLILAALAWLTIPAAYAEEESVAAKIGDDVKKGAKVVGNGIENGVDAAGRGVKKGLNATGNGLKKAGDWVEEKTRKNDKTSNNDSGNEKKE